MAVNRHEQRITRLEEQLRQAKARQQQIEARQRAAETKRTRQQDMRRKLLVGAVILSRVERGEWPGKELLAMLDTVLTRAEDRALFDLDTPVALVFDPSPEVSTIESLGASTTAAAPAIPAAPAVDVDAPPLEDSTIMAPSTGGDPIKAIVYPVVTAKDYSRPDPPIALARASKAQALAALRTAGYRVMTAGGSQDESTITAEALRNGRGDQPAVTEQERKLGHQLPDDAEIICYLVTVHPTALLRATR